MSLIHLTRNAAVMLSHNNENLFKFHVCLHVNKHTFNLMWHHLKHPKNIYFPTIILLHPRTLINWWVFTFMLPLVSHFFTFLYNQHRHVPNYQRREEEFCQSNSQEGKLEDMKDRIIDAWMCLIMQNRIHQMQFLRMLLEVPK